MIIIILLYANWIVSGSILAGGAVMGSTVRPGGDRRSGLLTGWLAVVALITFLTLALGRAADGDSYRAPRISADDLAALAKVPDWGGAYAMGGPPCPQCIIFDPDHFYKPPDPAADVGGADFGLLPGTYDTNIPYKPEYQKRYMAVVGQIKQGKQPDPVGNCMQPHGMPRQMSGIPTGPEIYMLPYEVLMRWGWMGAARHIYTDGRPHPTGPTVRSTFMGHSIGHWEGDTLVVDTVDMYAGQYDQTGAPHSDKVHLSERIQMIAPGTLEDRMTIEDPVMLTKPWNVVRTYRRMPVNTNFIDDGYCSPTTGDSTGYTNGYQNEILPFERDAKKNKSD
jgi:hypothetical protein